MKTWHWIAVILGGLIFPLVLNLAILQPQQFEIVGDGKTWLPFWATYLSAIASLAMVLVTLNTLKQTKQQFRELQKQNFENTLFQLLHEVKKIYETVGYHQHSGKNAFKEAYEFLKSMAKEQVGTGYNEMGDPIPAKDVPATKERAERTYSALYKNFYDVGSYFRSLYRVLKYVDESSWSFKEKYQYTSFVRSQLSDNELLLLFYNCSAGHGTEKFKPLVERYTILKNLPKYRLIEKDHETWFSPKAYQK